ncbi:MAG: tetratricopeptide repeat-containing sensor histidine kinase [Chloroflexota bacterium]
MDGQIQAIYQQIDNLNRLSFDSRYQDQDTGVKRSKDALDINASLPEQFFYVKGYVDSTNNLTWFNLFFSDYVEAYRLATEALEFADEHDYKLGKARAHGHLGRVKMYWGLYSDSIDSHQKQLKYAQQVDDKEECATAMSYLGHVYSRNGQLETAAEYYDSSLAIQQKQNNENGIAVQLINSAICYVSLGEIQTGLDRGLRGLNYAHRLNNQYVEAWALRAVAKAYASQGDYPTAISYLNQKYDITIAIKSEVQVLEALLEMGSVYIKLGELETAIEKLNAAFLIAEQKDFLPHQFRCYELYAQIYKQNGEFEKALAAYEQFHEIKERVFSNETTDKLKEIDQTLREEAAAKNEEIRRLKTVELDKKVQEATADLSEINDKLARAYQSESDLNRLKSQIVTTVSHEFRTPLTSIKVSVDLLNRYQERMSPEKREKIFGRINESIEYLEYMVQQVLNVDAIDGTLQDAILPEIEFNVLVEDLINNLREKFNQHGNLLCFDYNPSEVKLRVHVEKIMIVLHQLADNALKFSHYTKPVRIRVTLDQKLREAHFMISDSGIGILPEDLDKVWEPFYRSQAASNLRGLGLGLLMAQKKALSFGGYIVLDHNTETGGVKASLKVPF